ncbi:MAG TPA: hypothetical protein PK468_06045 [Candidatus Hydrogenedentes bacterium]|nr:hypothetical protein [Candidatus Hydrogenedentota bacterium]
MSAIVISVSSSLIASVVFAAVSTLIASVKFRKQLTVILSQLTGSGVDYVYANEKDAAEDLAKFTRRSEEVAIFGMRGFRVLSHDRPLHFLLEVGCPIKRLRCMCVDPDSEVARKRGAEYAQIDTSYSEARYLKDVRFSVDTLLHHAEENERISVKVHEQNASFRLLILDDYLFLSFFSSDAVGQDSKVLRIPRQSPLYRAFCRYFEGQWESGHDVKSREADVEQYTV